MMNPISFAWSGVLDATLTAFNTAFHGLRKTPKPAVETVQPDMKFLDVSDQFGITATGSFARTAATYSPMRETAEIYAGLLRDIPILVVDDNPIHQQIAARILETAGATVTAAGNGEQAVLLLEREQYHLIIMDLLMPVMDGYATTRYLRNHLHLGTPVLALGADPTPGRRKRCLEAGMNDYIMKPFELSDLFERIMRLLKLPAPQTA
jgi:CheY-like chemotaxis protein